MLEYHVGKEPAMVLRLIVVLLAFSAPIAAAQSASEPSPHEVDLCDLIRNAKSHDGQLISVRAHVIYEFENFTLDDSRCRIGRTSPTTEKGIWVTFGGDEPEIATFCCGSHKRKPGDDLDLAGRKVPLVRDEEFSRLLHRLTAQRLRRPDDKECGAECKYYEVTATLTGLFSAATTEAGYGHFGMFHLLAIQQAAAVSSKRRPIPFGGTFACATEVWKPKRRESKRVSDSLTCTDDPDTCTPSSSFGPVAAHWKDNINGGRTTEGYTDVNGDFIINWISADLLTSYFTVTTKDESLSITREHCQAVSPDRGPESPEVPVACQDYERGLDDVTSNDVDRLLEEEDFSSAWKRMSEGAKQLFNDGDQSWRASDAKTAGKHVLLGQAQEWGLRLDPEIRLDACQDSSLDETPTFVSCSWHSPDGKQSASVSLLKERPTIPSKGQQGIPWLVTKVSAQLCQTASE